MIKSVYRKSMGSKKKNMEEEGEEEEEIKMKGRSYYGMQKKFLRGDKTVNQTKHQDV